METERPGSFVLHIDVDSFFVQVEQLKDQTLQGKAVAVQQHQDIIAANYAARAAGVVKHMAPAEARRLLHAVGGRVVHVHLEPGGRVSYQPYRETSARMVKLLRTLPWVAVLEKASIDEAFLLLEPGLPAGTGAGGGTGGGPGDPGVGMDPQVALQHAQEAKAAVLQQLGLTVSVGVAPNRLLAKLASGAAKPDGIYLVPHQQAALQLLSRTPARKLPGFGGKAAEAFEQHGISTATDLQRYSQRQMEEQLGMNASAAVLLAQWCRGHDPTPVQERGPPKTLSVQMSLTPQLLKMHPSQGPTVSASGGKAGVLEPLVVGGGDFRLRVRQLMCAMGLDLLQRVLEDSADEGGRWPGTLTAHLRAFGGGRDRSFTSRSSAFPSRFLQGKQGRQQPQQNLQSPTVAQKQQHHHQQQQQQQLGPLDEAVVQALERLIHQAAGTYPPTAAVVELRLSATNFQLAAAAAAAAPITRFFAPAQHGRAGAQQGEQGQQPEQAQQQQQPEQAQQPEQPQQQQEQAQQQQGHETALWERLQQQQAQQQQGHEAALWERLQQQGQQGQQQEHVEPGQQPQRYPAPALQTEQPSSAAVGADVGSGPASAGPRSGLAGPAHNQSRCSSSRSDSGWESDDAGDPPPASAALAAGQADDAEAAGRDSGAATGGGVDLGSIDVEEQQRILQQIQQRQQQGQQGRQGRQRQQQGKKAQGGNTKKRQGTGQGKSGSADAKQPKILGFLKH